MLQKIIVLFIFVTFCFVKSQELHDPDSWHQSGPQDGNFRHSPDIVFEYTKSKLENNNNNSVSWFYKKLVMIILKNGIQKENEDKTLDITLHFKFSEEQWQTLFEIASSNDVLTDEKLRRSDGYISEAVYTAPYLAELASSWTQIILNFLTNNKMLILGTLLILLVLSICRLAVKYFSFFAVGLTIFSIIVYIWETIVMYKEYEQQEYEKFTSAAYYCKWKIWSSECNYPMPDVLQFYRYMNPVKIIPRIVSQFFTEPLIYCCVAMETVANNFSRNLSWPFSILAYYVLLLFFIVLTIQVMFILACNFIFNIPCTHSFLYISNISFGQRSKSINTNDNASVNSNRDQISGANVEKLLSITNLLLSQQVNQQQQIQNTNPLNPAVMPSTSGEQNNTRSTENLSESGKDNNNLKEEPSTSVYKRNKKKAKGGRER